MAVHKVHLTGQQRKHLEQFTTTGVHKAREIMRARLLLKCDEGLTDTEVAAAVGITKKTIWKVRKRFCEEGLEAALMDKPRPGAEKKVTPEIVAYIVAIACSTPPTGHAHMSIMLIKTYLEQQFHVELSYGTIQGVLKQHEMKPWKKRNGATSRSHQKQLSA